MAQPKEATLESLSELFENETPDQIIVYLGNWLSSNELEEFVEYMRVEKGW